MADEGDYICTAQNSAGKATAIAHIVVQRPPVITITPKTGQVTVKSGDYVRFECRATGHPNPTVQWSQYIPGAAEYSS